MSYALIKDNEVSWTAATVNQLLVRLQNTVSYSWDHAFRYEGWQIVPLASITLYKMSQVDASGNMYCFIKHGNTVTDIKYYTSDEQVVNEAIFGSGQDYMCKLYSTQFKNLTKFKIITLRNYGKLKKQRKEEMAATA